MRLLNNIVGVLAAVISFGAGLYTLNLAGKVLHMMGVTDPVIFYVAAFIAAGGVGGATLLGIVAATVKLSDAYNASRDIDAQRRERDERRHLVGCDL
jgi:hypothetical protein